MSDSKPTTGKSTSNKLSSAKSSAQKNISTGQPFPDLYGLLSLKPLETDRAVIETELRRLAAQVKSSQLADDSDSAATRNAKLFELGKHHLLSSERKKQYDQQWLQVYGGNTAKPTDAHAASKKSETATKKQTKTVLNSELSKLLPKGNPDEPFQLAEYLQSEVGQTLPNYDAEFEKLQSLLGSLDEQTTVAESVTKAETEVSHEVAMVSHEAVEPGRPSASNGLSNVGLGEGREKEGEKEGVGVGVNSARSVEPQRGERSVGGSFSKARQRRKQREQWILWGAIAGLTVVGSTLALLFWVNPSINTGSSESAVAVAQNKVGNTTHTSPSDLSATDLRPRRSGLPSVAGVSAQQDLTQNIDALVPVAPSEPASAAPPMPTEPDTSAIPLTQPGATVPTAEMEKPTEPMVEPPPQNLAPQPELTDADRAAWMTGMTSVKRLIGQQQYPQANELLAANEQLAKTAEQQAQGQRLKTISRLAEELQQALREAIDGLGAGQVVMIGTSTPVAFVDWDQTQLTVRIRGENRKFALQELPIGLAFALSDMSLDAQEPSTRARKAAFALVHPGAEGNDLALQRAREMMSAAVAAGVVDQDLMNAFNE